MEWIEKTIRDFGARIGVDGLSLSAEGGIHLESANGSIELHHLQESVPPVIVVLRSEPAGIARASCLQMALQCADFRRQRMGPVQVGSDEDQLILAVRIPERDFSGAVLEETLDGLERLHRQLGLLS